MPIFLEIILNTIRVVFPRQATMDLEKQATNANLTQRNNHTCLQTLGS